MANVEPLRVLIVDDEALAVERHTNLCRAIAGVEVVGALTSGRAVSDAVASKPPDLVLLDISMPGLDGMTLARALSALPKPPAVVFATAYDHHAVAAFELAAADYLLKPVAPERLAEAIERVRAGREPRSAARSVPPAVFWVPHGSRMLRLDTSELDLVEAERDYVRLHAGGRSFLLRATIGDFERRLDPALFVRVHRSTIVPIDGIRAVDGSTLDLSNGRRVRVGRSFRSALRRLLTTCHQSG